MGFTIGFLFMEGGNWRIRWKSLSPKAKPSNKLKPHLMPVLEGACLNSINNLSGAIHQADASITVKFTCQGNVMNLHCQSPIKIYSATYIRTQDSICYHGNSANYCDPVDKMSLVRKHCEGQMTCNISVDRNTMEDKCPIGFLYLKVMYDCSK